MPECTIYVTDALGSLQDALSSSFALVWIVTVTVGIIAGSAHVLRQRPYARPRLSAMLLLSLAIGFATTLGSSRFVQSVATCQTEGASGWARSMDTSVLRRTGFPTYSFYERTDGDATPTSHHDTARWLTNAGFWCSIAFLALTLLALRSRHRSQKLGPQAT